MSGSTRTVPGLGLGTVLRSGASAQHSAHRPTRPAGRATEAGGPASARARLEPRHPLSAMRAFLLAALLASAAAAQPAIDPADDPFVWLEDVEGERALDWVETQNRATAAELRATPLYDALYRDALAVVTSDDRIPYPSLRGDEVYNLWTDAEHPRGLWRRASLDAYLGGDPAWETMLDIGRLGEDEGVTWTWGGSTCLPESTRCLVRLSRGGADATEVREFDTETLAFVDDGFRMPEAKSSAAWMDADRLLVSTDWGPGALTESGYPRIAKVWTRGTPLADAETVFEAPATDMGVWAGSMRDRGRIRPVLSHRPSFFQGSTLVVDGQGAQALDVPLDADPMLVDGQLVVYLRSDWKVGGETFAQGALVAMDLDDFLDGDREFVTVFAPGARQTVEGTSTTRTSLLVTTLDEVRGRLTRYRYDDGEWVGTPVEVPDLGTVSVVSADDESDRFFFNYSSFLQPSSLYLAGEDGSVQLVRQLPSQFDATGLTVEQHTATSADGTAVPYFVVSRDGLERDGTHPTQLYGYGGFEVSLTSSYSALTGKAWLERGGVYVLATIRGGGEFGPAWHRSAMRENRQRAYDDFIAVAEDLVARGITSPDHLGIRGGSNGGLLVGAVTMQRPELFGAVVCSVPLLDMYRYDKLLAGASWVAEYGDPDDADDWAFVSQYSPYQNVRSDADYPRILFTTTTRDDRVHPGHARKMAARMMDLGHPVYYFENTEGGHGSGVTPEQQATAWATIYAYLWDALDG